MTGYASIRHGKPSLRKIGTVMVWQASWVCTDRLWVPVPPMTTMTMSSGFSAIGILQSGPASAHNLRIFSLKLTRLPRGMSPIPPC